MADKIIGGVGHLLGIGGKKKAAAPAAPAAEQKGPIITKLGAPNGPESIRRRLISQAAPGLFGQSPKLGG